MFSKLSFTILLAESYLSVCVYQMNLNGKLRKNLGEPSRGPSKNLGGPWPTQAPIRIATGGSNSLLLFLLSNGRGSAAIIFSK